MNLSNQAERINSLSCGKIQAGPARARDEGAKERICQVNKIGPYTIPK